MTGMNRPRGRKLGPTPNLHSSISSSMTFAENANTRKQIKCFKINVKIADRNN